jgi:hypothetical protein
LAWQRTSFPRIAWGMVTCWTVGHIYVRMGLESGRNEAEERSVRPSCVAEVLHVAREPVCLSSSCSQESPLLRMHTMRSSAETSPLGPLKRAYQAPLGFSMHIPVRLHPGTDVGVETRRWRKALGPSPHCSYIDRPWPLMIALAS